MHNSKNAVRALYILAFVAVAVLVLGLLFGCATTGAGNPSAPWDSETEGTAYPDPDPDDFTLTPKILEKHCFGTAGCNITIRVEVSYDGPDLDPNQAYELTYEVVGTEDTFISTLIFRGGGYRDPGDKFIGTSSKDVELELVILELEPKL